MPWLFYTGFMAGIFLATAWTSAAARGLSWDQMEKSYQAKPGETLANFEFAATNRTTESVLIFEAVPSCGCTTAQLPAQPWSLPSGVTGMLKVTVDLTGKRGDLEKTVEVRTSAGTDTLRLHIFIPPDLKEMARDQRPGNILIARANRQAVFKGSCASCHAPADPVRTSAELFQRICAICHESPHRASMVPDLAERGAGKGAAYWTQWVEHGREGSLMPAFAVKQQGILPPDKVDQLVAYLMQRYGAQRGARIE